MLQKFKDALENKPEFWEKVRKENIEDSEKYFFVILCLSTLFTFLLQVFLSQFFPVTKTPAYINYIFSTLSLSPYLLLFFSVLFSKLLAFGGTFVLAAIIHWFMKMENKSVLYQNTLKVLIYASGAGFLFSFVPVAGSLLSLYGIYLMICGLKLVHSSTSGKQAAQAYFKAILFIIFLVVIVPLLILGTKNAKEQAKQDAIAQDALNKYVESQKDKIDPATGMYLYENSYEKFRLEYPTTWNHPWPSAFYLLNSNCELESVDITPGRLSTGLVSQSQITIDNREFTEGKYFDSSKRSPVEEKYKFNMIVISDFPVQGKYLVLSPKYPTIDIPSQCITDYQLMLSSFKFLK